MYSFEYRKRVLAIVISGPAILQLINCDLSEKATFRNLFTRQILLKTPRLLSVELTFGLQNRNYLTVNIVNQFEF